MSEPFRNNWMCTYHGEEMEWYCGTCGLHLTREHDDTAVVRQNTRTYAIQSIECAECYNKRVNANE